MCGSIPHASSVIHVKAAIQHSKHREHSALRCNHGVRKPESFKNVERPKSAKLAQAWKNELPRAVDPHQINYGGGETLHRGYEKRLIWRRRRLASHGEPIRDI